MSKEALAGFPSDDLSPLEKKQEAYNLKAAKYIWNQFYSGMDTIGRDKRADFKENRLFADGNQDNRQYMEATGLKKDNQGNYVSYSDIDYTPIGLCRNIVRSILNKLRNIRFDPEVEAIDSMSQSEKNEKLAEIQAKMMLAPVVKEILGTDIADGEYLPNSQQELEMYKKIGMKLSDEIAMEYYLKAVANDNKYEYYVEKACDHDFVCCDMAGQYLYYDENGFVRMEHIDMADFGIINGGKKRDFTDAKAFCIVKNYSIEELRMLCPDELSDEEWTDIAMKINRNNVTPYQTSMKDRYLLSQIFADVAICYWQTIDTYTKEEKDGDDGSKRVKMRASDWKPGENSKRKAYTTKVHKWYTAWYIPNAQKVLKYGPMPNMIRKKYKSKKNRALCPVTVVRVSPNLVKNSASIIDSIKKFENLATLAYIKVQNELANALPDGLEINIEAVAAGTDYVKTQDLQEAIAYGMQTNKWFIARKGGLDDMNSGRAIQSIPGGATKALSDYIMIIRTAKDFMHELSGVPQVDVGGQQAQQPGKAVTERILMGADRVLDDIAESKRMMNELVGEKVLNMVLDILNPNTGMRNPYEDIISRTKSQVLEISSDLYVRDMGFSVKQQMTSEEVNQLLQDLLSLSTRYRETNGNEGISPTEYVFLKENFQENPKMAVLMMQHYSDMRAQENKKKAMQDQMMNQQVQASSADQSHANQSELMQLQAALEDKKHQHEMERLQLEYKLKKDMGMAVAGINADAKIQAAEAANDHDMSKNILQQDHEQDMKMMEQEHEKEIKKNPMYDTSGVE